MNPDQTPAAPVKSKSNCLAIALAIAIALDIVFLIIILILLLANPFTKTSNQSNSNGNTPVSSQVNNQSQQTTVMKTKSLSATVPTGWTIVEYSDNTGMKYAVSDVTYSGVTGFDILKNGSVFFSLKGVDGVGGGPCMDVDKFSDTDPAYITQLTNDLMNATGDTLTVSDLSAQNHTDVTLLGIGIRRVGSTYYLNTSADPSKFNTGCGIEKTIWGLKTIGFSINGAAIPANTASPYSWKITPVNPSADDLSTLDTILGSITKL